MGDRLAIMGLSWSSGSPMAAVRRAGGPSRSEPLRDLALGFRVDEADVRRLCLGHSGPQKADDPPDCPNPPEPGSKTCTSCSVKNALFASGLHHAHTRDAAAIDPDMAVHLGQPNRLYLAAFRDGSIKVGTSTGARAQTRLLEQGAWLARFVADADDGIAVRVLEDLVTADLGLPQSVAITRKLRGLDSPNDDRAILDELTTVERMVHRVIEDLGDPRVLAASEPWVNPATDDSNFRKLHRYPHRLDQGAHQLDLVTALGRAAVFARPGGTDLFVADLGQIFGLEIELSATAETEDVVVQDSLF